MDALDNDNFANNPSNIAIDPLSYFFHFVERQKKIASLSHLSYEDFIKTIYLQILQRPVEDDGLAYYLSLLTSNHLSAEAFIIDVANSPEALDLIQKGAFDASYYMFLQLAPLQQLAQNNNLLGITGFTAQQLNQLQQNQLDLVNTVNNLTQRLENFTALSSSAILSSQPPHLKPLKLLIDMQGLQGASRDRGIGRYTLGLVGALIRQQDSYEVYLLLNMHFPDMVEVIRQKFAHLLPGNRFICWSPIGSPHENIEDRKYSEQIFERTVIEFNPDCFLLSNMFEGYEYSNSAITKVDWIKKANILVACILYDLIPLISPTCSLRSAKAKNWYFDKLAYLNNVDILLAISASAQKEGLSYLKLPADNIVNIASAVSHDDYYPIAKQSELLTAVKEKFALDKPFIMHTAGGDERKNVKGLIQAFALLNDTLKSIYQLVIVFDLSPKEREVLYEYARQYQVEHHLTLTGFVTHEELIALYNLASLFVFPSLHEGFGLPVLEAMLCGCPTIASNTSSLPEVVGNNHYTFDPYSAQDIADKITEILGDNAAYQALMTHCQSQAENFSWNNTAITAINTLQAATRQRRLKPHLYLDISELIKVDAKSGIQRVVKALIHEFIFNPLETMITYLVYIDKDLTYQFATQFTHQLFGIESNTATDMSVTFKRGDCLYLVDFAPSLQSQLGDFYKNLRHQGIQVIALVHDLIPLLHPEWWSHDIKDKRNVANGFEQWLNTVRQGSGAICVSETTQYWFKRWIVENNFDIQPREFFTAVAKNGADITFNFASHGLPDNYDQLRIQLTNANTFVMIGTLEPRKGHKDVLDAFETLWAKNLDYNLVIVGKIGWLVNELIERIQQHPQLNQKLFYFSGISDEFLSNIYELSTALIAASYDEGFGLPLIEAAAHQLPVIARDIPVFREVGKDSVIYFDNQLLPLAEVIQTFSPQVITQPMTWLSWQQSGDRHKAIIQGEYRELQNINNHLHFWANNTHITSYVGDINLNGLVTTQTAGVLVYSYPITLEAGHWQFIANFTECKLVDITLIISYNHGQNVAIQQPLLLPTPHQHESVTIDFEIPSTQIQITIDTTAESSFTLNTMSFKKYQ